MADDVGVQTLAAVAADVKKARPLRRAKPLVAVPGVIGGPDPTHVQRQHARGMGAVDQRIDAAAAKLLTSSSMGKTTAVGLVT